LAVDREWLQLGAARFETTAGVCVCSCERTVEKKNPLMNQRVFRVFVETGRIELPTF
jgi:hypothetical protein